MNPEVSPQTPTPTPASVVAPTPQPTPAGAPNPITPEIEPIPTEWPGGFGLYKHSKAAVKFNFNTLLILFIANMLLSGLAQGLERDHPLLPVVSLATGFVALTSAIAYLASVRKQKLSIGDALKQAIQPKLWLNAIGLAILAGLTVAVSILLLVVPFFFVLPRVWPSLYFVLDGKGPVEALKASFAATKGHVGKIYGVIGATIAIELLFVTIIGIPFAIYFLFMYGAATAITYVFITKNAPATSTPIAPAPTATPVAQPPVT